MYQTYDMLELSELAKLYIPSVPKYKMFRKNTHIKKIVFCLENIIKIIK